MTAYAHQFFPEDLRRKGSSETLILPCVLGSCVFFSLLLSSDLDLITDIEMGRDSQEAPEKWELVLLVAFEGRWGRTASLSRSYLLRKGQENNTAKQLPAENTT